MLPKTMKDHGEFFHLVLGQVKAIYFDNCLKEMFREKYVAISIILRVSLKLTIYFTLYLMRKKNGVDSILVNSLNRPFQ